MEKKHSIIWHDVSEDKTDLPGSNEFCLIYVNTVRGDGYLVDATYDANGRIWMTISDDLGIEGVYGIDEVLAWTPWDKLMWDRYV